MKPMLWVAAAMAASAMFPGSSAAQTAAQAAAQQRCLNAAYQQRTRDAAICRPNPRDPRIYQSCIARANGSYERAVARCQSAPPPRR